MRILFCTGGSEKSENAIRAGARLASKLGAEGTVLSVGPPAGFFSKMLGAEFRKTEVNIGTDQAVAKISLNMRRGGEDT